MPEFAPIECVLLIAILIFVGWMVRLMFKKSNDSGSHRWGR